MSTYPTNLKRFRLWAKAMEAGATVGRPNYGKELVRGGLTQDSVAQQPHPQRMRKRRRRRRRRAHHGD